jgi:cytochrome c-type biogenesis protein CcmF
MIPNESVEISGYQIEFKGVKQVEGPNYSAEQGQIYLYEVNTDGENDFVTLLKPERRTYRVQTMGMTEAGIDGGLFRDVYVALGDPLDGDAWAIRVHYKPFVRWIWLGAIFMAIGGILAMMDKRYRVAKKNKGKENTSVNNEKIDGVNNNTSPISELS